MPRTKKTKNHPSRLSKAYVFAGNILALKDPHASLMNYYLENEYRNSQRSAISKNCTLEIISKNHKEEARILCAQLIPHTTSVQNVDKIVQALRQAELRGAHNVIKQIQDSFDAYYG